MEKSFIRDLFITTSLVLGSIFLLTKCSDNSVEPKIMTPGTDTTYYNNKKILSIIDYYPDGDKKTEKLFHNNDCENPKSVTNYLPNGNKESKEEWCESCVKKSETTYYDNDDNTKHTYLEWFENENIKFAEDYHANGQLAIKEEFYEDVAGQLKERTVMDLEGNITSHVKYDKNGDVIVDANANTANVGKLKFIGDVLFQEMFTI